MVFEYPTDALGHAQTRLLCDTHGGRNNVGYRAGVAHWSKFDHEHTVREVVHRLGTNLEGQSRLAPSANARQRHQAVRLERGLHFGDVRLSADQAGGRGAQIAWRGVNCLERWKFGRQAGPPDLKDIDWPGDVA